MDLSRFKQLARNFDWILVLLVAGLVAISLVAIYSVDLSRGAELDYFSTQSSAVVIGLVFFLFASFFHVSFYRQKAKFFYLLAFLLLLGVLIFGETIRGTRGWFHFFGFSFQPAEFAKVGLIIMLAWWLERFGRRFEKWQFVFTSALLTLFLAGLILLQPDLGSAIVLSAIWFGILCLSGTKKRYIFALVILAVLMVIFAWFFLFQDYQRGRILTFINPELDPLGSGYNVTQSMIAIGSGQIVGRGLGFGSQSQLHFLPEAQTDFIFSVIAEELGFVGGGLVLLLYFLLLWRLITIIRRAKNDFSAFLVSGVLLLFLTQIVINLGAAMGFMPVVGVTLPFLSYGGSSLIINLLLLGMVESVAQSGTIAKHELYES